MVAVILVINGALVTMLKNLRKTGEIEISGKIEIGQLTALLRLTRIFGELMLISQL